jgi:hypothetical protein
VSNVSITHPIRLEQHRTNVDHVDVHNVDGAFGPDFNTIEQQHITEWDDLPRKVHSRMVGKSRALEGADRSLVKLCADRSLRPSR